MYVHARTPTMGGVAIPLTTALCGQRTPKTRACL